MKKKLRIVITGPMGRMGKMLIQETKKNDSISLKAALVQNNSPFIGQDVGKAIGIEQIGISISNKLNIKENDFDVLIDFTEPNATLKYLEYCNQFKKNIVIGTTGFSKQNLDIIKKYSKNISIVLSSNFSIGINLMFQLIKNTTKILGHQSDIDIIEYHHRNKIDAPSGTALTMGKIISQVMNWDLSEHSIYYRKGITGIREKEKIGFSSIRTGDIIGKHIVMFSSHGEEITLKHTASNRASFAKGAIASALWLKKQKPGLFDMMDVLSFN
jgi:4-hydroxy-tetrahydrodipicolinate reductase